MVCFKHVLSVWPFKVFEAYNARDDGIVRQSEKLKSIFKTHHGKVLNEKHMINLIRFLHLILFQKDLHYFEYILQIRKYI